MARKRPPEPDPSGYVYVIRLFGYYKIGRTQSVASRMKTLSPTLLPESPVLVFSGRVYNAAKVESTLHKRYAASRAQGEWFRLTPFDLIEIEEFVKSKYKPCGCLPYEGGPARHCAEAARLRRELPPILELPEDEASFNKLPYAQHFLNL